MDDIICTELESEEGKFTGFPSGKLCFGNEKKMRLIEYCEKNNRLKEDAWFYSDSIDDLHALNAACYPVCVNPCRRLKKHAVKKEWKIVTW
jgi:phosphoserine phosphatase